MALAQGRKPRRRTSADALPRHRACRSSREASATCAASTAAARSATRRRCCSASRSATVCVERAGRPEAAARRRLASRSEHTLIDLGDDVFTRGRPHPMIDHPPAQRADVARRPATRGRGDPARRRARLRLASRPGGRAGAGDRRRARAPQATDAASPSWASSAAPTATRRASSGRKPRCAPPAWCSPTSNAQAVRLARHRSRRGSAGLSACHEALFGSRFRS